jgi:hypothetical protein
MIMTVEPLKIDPSDESCVAFWALVLDVPPQQLHEAVTAVGTGVHEVTLWLERMRPQEEESDFIPPREHH